MNDTYKKITVEDYTFLKWARSNFQFSSDQQAQINELYRKLVNPNVSKCSGCKAYSQILDFKRELDVFVALNLNEIEKHLSQPTEETPVETITPPQNKPVKKVQTIRKASNNGIKSK
jgi:hypothetical protein